MRFTKKDLCLYTPWNHWDLGDKWKESLTELVLMAIKMTKRTIEGENLESRNCALRGSKTDNKGNENFGKWGGSRGAHGPDGPARLPARNIRGARYPLREHISRPCPCEAYASSLLVTSFLRGLRELPLQASHTSYLCKHLTFPRGPQLTMPIGEHSSSGLGSSGSEI
ncbi:hypothetical protein Gogos_003661 [Gossypium gossypioides]|uniref:Uncharacterized protein n=1 Tax=Gossypium gossypioides TaxID=34282 RepID=A0A7J9CN27_GOSGO|nr:hypothetical protein [Gossypium gossypioides]